MSRTGRIHYAKLENSPRLQEVLAFLRERGGRGATTREILCGCPSVCAVNSVADELRENGFDVPCVPEFRQDLKKTVYRYTLRENGPQMSLI